MIAIKFGARLTSRVLLIWNDPLSRARRPRVGGLACRIKNQPETTDESPHGSFDDESR